MLGALTLGGFGVAYGLTKFFRAKAPAGMVEIPGGEFFMGSAGNAPAHERPAHPVKIDAFWMDETEVTNAAFAEFVAATNYITTAEKPIDWEQLRKSLPPDSERPPDERLAPGSMVFTPTTEAVPLNNFAAWWRWVPGANWRHPEGPASNIEGKGEHPVVQVSWDDAVAFCEWAGKRLPTEAEWECAARGGLAGTRFSWGEDVPTDSDPRANIWQGDFPYRNTEGDGYMRTAPVKQFPANGYGLYDMAGNVWEWCSDWYRVDIYTQRDAQKAAVNPAGPSAGWDPNHPHSPGRVTRGGSFLCHVSYCESYRPAARRGTPPDTGMSHIGFRCAKSK